MIPGAVLTGFGLDVQTAIRPIGRAVIVGDLVLKPVDDDGEATWIAEAMSSLAVDDIRVERPVRANDGRWILEGWSAWEKTEGRPALRWYDILAAARTFHAAMRSFPCPQLPERDADTRAWADEHEGTSDLIGALGRCARPVDLVKQVVHGDLTRNVLFAPGMAPAVTSFVPYLRPAGWALAIVVVDAIVWHGAPLALADALDDEPEADQLLVRATLFRLYGGEPEPAHRLWVEYLIDRF